MIECFTGLPVLSATSGAAMVVMGIIYDFTPLAQRLRRQQAFEETPPCAQPAGLVPQQMLQAMLQTQAAMAHAVSPQRLVRLVVARLYVGIER